MRSGVTSDVFSVNAAGQKAASTLAGSGSLTQAYGAIASAPGVNIPSNQQGWYQSVYVRGGDVDQVAYEFDGLPTTRQSDLAPIATLTSLGNQEVQVYTGGTPATSNSSGLAGYINQVIKTGTFPGYADADLGIGGAGVSTIRPRSKPAGATPDRLFSYYVGLVGHESRRFATAISSAASAIRCISIRSRPDEQQRLQHPRRVAAARRRTTASSSQPGYSYAQAINFDRENVVNFHVGIPHRDSPLRDDIQMLYVTGGIATQFYSSANDIGYTPLVGSEDRHRLSDALPRLARTTAAR